MRQEVFDTLKCGAEFIATDTTFFKSNNKNIFFGNASYQTTDKVFSGKYSIVTHNKNPYGFHLKLNGVKPCDRIWYSVWRYPARSPVAAVASSENATAYYESESNRIIAEKDGWGLLVNEFVIPEDYPDSTVVFYLLNFLEESVWFDDIEIKRLQIAD